MSKLVLVNLNLNGNELQNAVIQPLAAAPETGKAGQIYFNTNDKLLYQHDGTKWAVVGPVTSVAGKTGAVTLVKADVGLDKVDNTSDAEKKTAFTGEIADGNTGFAVGGDVFTALAGKLDLGGGTMSGNIAMGGSKVTGLGTPTADGDAATKKYVDDVAADIPEASDANPLMDGTAAAGTAETWSRADHVHPVDTSRQAAITANGILKGDGAGNVTAAIAETDYGTYSKPTGGIPKADLAQAVQDSLDAADNAVLKDGSVAMTGDLAMGTHKITGLADPTNAQDAATKNYVDSAVSDLGSVLNFKGTKASTAELPLTGNKQGDVWIVSADNSEYVWTLEAASGTLADWEKLGPVIDLSGYAPLVSPAFDGTPTAPTAATGTNTTQIATTAFVKDAIDNISGVIETGTGTITAGQTSVSVTYDGTLVNTYATMGGADVIVEKAVTASTVTFTIATAVSTDIICTVVSTAS